MIALASVKLQVNGKDVAQMPVNRTPIQSALTREMGINLDTKDEADIPNTKPLTVYYVGGETGGLLLCSSNKTCQQREC
ncbi:hypothetical protein NDK25_07765 [Niallia taxi]|nr:hypothetical protein [Niallia taxi]MDE5052282.1 hypothetical protein [Niallia taxi]